ncbi:MAG: hgdB, partial [Deltaproteobacteria bacterium]|nr:hgdB [Deltaproteobacteria bacterium]MBS1244173.1 hgdB [Deltaproteobacteria bacterium]
MRAATISARKKLGKKTVVVLPVHYPRELFTAMDVHTVELWGPPGPPRGPDAGRIQPYACAIVRNALAFLASGGADAADAVLFPHTCDSIQGLATLAPDFGGW